MSGRQLDLFSGSGYERATETAEAVASAPALVAADLDDTALVAAIPSARLKEAPVLAAEAGQRRLQSAVPALLALCRRFTGFGADDCPVPEQIAALDALAAIGGAAAAQATGTLLVERVVLGPNRERAVSVAARLGTRLPTSLLLELMADPAPTVREAACGCVRQQLALVPRLLELAHDEAAEVRTAAACALGRMGRRDVLPMLTRLLREAPTIMVIDAVAAIADEDCVILLARLARSRNDLAEAALDALAVIDHPRARQLLARLEAERGN
jgi:hypothetical protein